MGKSIVHGRFHAASFAGAMATLFKVANGPVLRALGWGTALCLHWSLLAM
jgi:hypothetical protein